MSPLLSSFRQAKLNLFWVMIIDYSIITTGFVLCPWETICSRGPWTLQLVPNFKHSAWVIVAVQQMFVELDWRGFSVAAGMLLPDVFLSLLWRVGLFISGLPTFQLLNRICMWLLTWSNMFRFLSLFFVCLFLCFSKEILFSSYKNFIYWCWLILEYFSWYISSFIKL